ncbi:MAG: NAD(P)/FAD-dependent oxidoreductase [Nitrosopumilus sp.]
MESSVVNFSIKKETFFITLGSILGAFVMVIPNFLSDAFTNSEFYLFWIVAARILGSNEYAIGALVHFGVATIIGIIVGFILYKTNMLNISKISNGILFGMLAGGIVTIVFAIPVQYFWVQPTMAEINNLPILNTVISQSFLINSFLTHFLWGGTLGVLASILTAKRGMNYRCHKCDIEFSKLEIFDEHDKYVHRSTNPQTKKILILGGGYAGVGVLNEVQRRLQGDVDVSIEIVSESNFFLHTPMLPEMATGTIEARHIATPIRNFCKRARFYQAKVLNIDLSAKSVLIKRNSGTQSKSLEYNFLVLALGGKTNFFGNKNIERDSFTIKTLDDAIKIRNHIISVLEEADQETDPVIQSKLATFVVVGGGFSGVETVGEINDFVRESVQKFYRNIDPAVINVILVASGNKILPEIGNLGEYAKKSLDESGVTIFTNTRLNDLDENIVYLNNGKQVPSHTVIWAGGNTVNDVIKKLDSEHHKSGRLAVDEYLRLKNYSDVFALGDCSYVIDSRTNSPYPPTAQHAIREAKTVSDNLFKAVKNIQNPSRFIYDTKGSMAKIGNKNGVALLMGHEFRGFSAWFIWKQYYLSTLPTFEKRIRVGLDWFVDLFFPRDITKLN